MSVSNISSSIIYKIRQEREKRQIKAINSNPNKINFYLQYQESHVEHDQKELEEARLKIKEKVHPMIKPENETKSINHAKRISLNFDFFKPKRQGKEQGGSRANYEQIFSLCKQKYMDRIEKYKRKKSEKNNKTISVFGLNIRTVDRLEVKTVNQGKTRPTITHHSNHRIRHQNRSKQNIRPTPNIQPKKDPEVKERSKSFAIETHPNIKEIGFIKLKMRKMINSNNLVLQSFGLYLCGSNQEVKYKFYVGNGNNCNLIRSILKQRFWWMETNEIASAHLVWTQLKNTPTLERIQELDYQQVHKANLKVNRGGEEGQVSHGNEPQFFHPKLSLKLQQFTHQRQKRNSLRAFSIPGCVHNHFTHNFMFGNKNALFQNLTRYYHYKQQDVYQIIPLTFVIKDCSSKGFEDFVKVASQMKNAIWIVKPGENSNRGNGIFVTKYPQEMRSKISQRKSNHTYIIQKYITNLLLYHKRKFDIRTYLLMLSIGGVTKFFWYNEGYIRTSSEVFDLKDLNDFFIHLTNDAIQKKSQSYGKFQNGNKISFNEFQRYLDSTNGEKNWKVQQLNQEMKKIAQKAVNATYNKLNPQNKNYGFQLFGLDFIVDSNFRPWLIEINTNPCLQLSSPTLQRLIPRMMQNLFRVCLDPVFQAWVNVPKSKSYYIYQNCLQKNKFEMIFDSAFDSDAEWQRLSEKDGESVYEQNGQTFQGDGQELMSIY